MADREPHYPKLWDAYHMPSAVSPKRPKLYVTCRNCDWTQPIENGVNIRAHQKTGHTVLFRGHPQAIEPERT